MLLGELRARVALLEHQATEGRASAGSLRGSVCSSVCQLGVDSQRAEHSLAKWKAESLESSYARKLSSRPLALAGLVSEEAEQGLGRSPEPDQWLRARDEQK